MMAAFSNPSLIFRKGRHVTMRVAGSVAHADEHWADQWLLPVANLDMAVHEGNQPSLAVMQCARALVELTVARDVEWRPTIAPRLGVQEREDAGRIQNRRARSIKGRAISRRKGRHVAVQIIVE